MNLEQMSCSAQLETPLGDDELKKYSLELKYWKFDSSKTKLIANFTFNNFRQAMKLSQSVGDIAEQQNHHPDIQLGWGYCSLSLWTYSVKALTLNDFILAKKIEKLIPLPT